jgi:hypothetical protein
MEKICHILTNSRKDRQVHFVKMKKPGKPNEKFNKTVLFVRRIISNKGMVAGVEVDIKSPALKAILDEIFAGVDGLRLNKTPPVVCWPRVVRLYER